MSVISALISAYRAKEFLADRLDNLLFESTGVNVQPIVICRGGSSEDEIASQYAIKIIRTVDVPTIGEAWNLGIEAAMGDYLTTANTDDLFLPGGLQKMADVLDANNKIGLVFSQVDLDDGRKAFPWKRIGNPTGEVKNIGEILKQRCIIGPMPMWRRKIHKRIGKFRDDFVVANDYDMWVRMAGNGVKFYYIAESCGVYKKRMDSLEHRNKHLAAIESLEVKQNA